MRLENIPHYHGDYVRILFVAITALSFFSIPLFGHLVPKFGTGLEVLGGILLITLAGLTNPNGKIIMTINCVVSAFGILLFELSAIAYRQYDPIQLLVVREIGVLLFLMALYFSVKTVRAMYSGTMNNDSINYNTGKIPSEKDSWQ